MAMVVRFQVIPHWMERTLPVMPRAKALFSP